MATRNNRKSWPLWLTVPEAAELLRLHPKSVYEMAKKGQLPVFRIGSAVRIDRDALFRTARKELLESLNEVAKKVI